MTDVHTWFNILESRDIARLTARIASLEAERDTCVLTAPNGKETPNSRNWAHDFPEDAAELAALKTQIAQLTGIPGRPRITSKLANVSSRRGAPMGRQSFVEDDLSLVKLHLHACRINSGGYDEGGAYWGQRPSGIRLYRAWEQQVELFYDATSRDDAKARIHANHPQARFVGGC